MLILLKADYQYFDYFENDARLIQSPARIAVTKHYRYLKQEVTQLDKWGRVAESLEHGEIKSIFQSKAIKDYLNDRDIGVFLDNEELYKKM